MLEIQHGLMLRASRGQHGAMSGLRKIALDQDMGRQDPSKMEANLGASWPPRPPPKWRRRLGGQDAPIDIFLSAQVGGGPTGGLWYRGLLVTS